MPFIDLNESSIDFTANSFDIVIVGAGAVGILLAVELSKKNKRVLLLESGHFTEDEQRQELNTVIQTGKPVTSAVWGRKRAIGGTTIAWGGQSLPFSRLDFEKRDWVQYSGWPITYEELAPYYHLANRFMDIDELDYDGDIFRLLKMKKTDFNENLIHHHFSKWAPEPNFRIIYQDHLSKHVTVVYNAALTKLQADFDGKINAATVKNYKGQSYSISIPRLVLATGGIETNRILLNESESASGGFGNHSGWLGKCFMEHPCIEVGEIHTDRPWKLQAKFNTHILKKRKYSVRLSLAEALQKKEGLLNGSAGILMSFDPGDHDPYEAIRKIIKQKKLPSVKQLLTGGISSYALSFVALFSQHFVYKHKARIKLIMMMEQEPVVDSCISLSHVKDIHGVKLASMHWKITHKTWNSVVCLSKIVSEEMQRLAIGKVVLHDHITENTPDWENYLSDVNHHMGGTRMSNTPAGGVVNTDLQVWGHDNLFVCSSSVFPTSSHSNPTLTLLALAQRLVVKLV